jgi:XTP/dITP diphosphohydrolase
LLLDMDRLVIATGNAHKTEEIREMLGELVGEMTDLKSHPEVGEIEETGTTFEQNATLKAVGAGKLLGDDVWVLADDSGLEVDALDRAPGVYSARYSGEGATDASNREKLIAELAKTGARGKGRSGRFRCVLVLAKGTKVIATFDGACEGVIANGESGEGGFGYDRLFIPDGECATFGELSAEVKNSMSHRARALEGLKMWLEERGAA